MNAYGDFACAQVCGSHLICITRDHEGKDLSLARSEKAVMALQLGKFGSLLSRGSINGNRVIDCVHQCLLTEWFRKELNRTGLHGAYRRRDIPMSRDENNRRSISVRQLLLKFEAARSRKLQVQNQACWGVGFFAFQELGGRTEDSDLKSHRGYEAAQRLSHSKIVVNHKNDGAVRIHCSLLLRPGG